ncbi:MAG: C40 family peptidase [Novosphingobium sp.]|nr:C40 family peptidase [Novosphingobium sp.]
MTASAPDQADYSGQYALSGPAKVRDARVTPIRGDLADIALAGKLFAPHYVVPMERAVTAAFAPLRKTPHDDAEQISELLENERFMVLDMAGAWAWGYCQHDCYNGYVALDLLGEPQGAAPVASAGDPVEAALACVGTPYVWGARGGAGIDCSGLVQTAFAHAGQALPRDSDQQEARGEAVADAQRGDLVFFPGHVAIATSADEVVHASQDASGIGGAVVIEPLAALVARKGEPTHIRRLA